MLSLEAKKKILSAVSKETERSNSSYRSSALTALGEISSHLDAISILDDFVPVLDRIFAEFDQKQKEDMAETVTNDEKKQDLKEKSKSRNEVLSSALLCMGEFIVSIFALV
ncbi:hypothetical protein RFI_23718 [Reticulomyxa filosa]|uniref:Uncharacterized protein n=1 Tax=Reticulomyxa filosa TaxID=46433 RepID=X6MKP0_RETFI|nr:hypothetical protein RFI_23718 [Reticulomyxa filosa]|eukprot:ETO13650.1 hypothetical protein RFI_23718 [Reticulomyxa filosa]